MDVLLGLDVGTTAGKSVLFDLQGNVVAAASSGYGLITPRAGWVEQDPEELWRGAVETIRCVASQIGPGDRILALAQSSQGGTTIPVDAAGRPTYHAISWMDERAGEQARQVRGRWGADFIRTTTGWPLYDGLPLQHIRWLRHNRPDDFARTRHFLFVNDFITHRLTGKLCMNPPDASITQLMNVATGDWDQRLLDIAGIGRDQLSPMHPSGYVVGALTAETSQTTGLPQDTLVVNGAHDQYCAAVGAGVTRPGRVLLSCGTAWVTLAVPESLEVGLRSGMSVSRHAAQGRWGALRSLGGVGASLEWLIDQVWGGHAAGTERSDVYRAINAGAARSAPGAQGLLFYPLAGGHAAGFGPSRGGWIGLSLSHSRDDLARAVMEGTAFELRWAIQEIRQAGVQVGELRMVGGAAESAVWPQIVADVAGLPVVLPTVRQAASRGAAILAGVGAGIFADPETGFAAFQGQETRLEPLAENCALYETAFYTYQHVYWELAGALEKDLRS
jgi:xylulokinase